MWAGVNVCSPNAFSNHIYADLFLFIVVLQPVVFRHGIRSKSGSTRKNCKKEKQTKRIIDDLILFFPCRIRLTNPCFISKHYTHGGNYLRSFVSSKGSATCRCVFFKTRNVRLTLALMKLINITGFLNLCA